MVGKILFNRLGDIGTKPLVLALFDALPGLKERNLVKHWLISKLEAWSTRWLPRYKFLLLIRLATLSDVSVGTLVDNLADRLEEVESETLGNKLGNLKVYLLVVKLADTIAKMKTE